MRSRSRWRNIARVAPLNIWDGRNSIVFFFLASVLLLLFSLAYPSTFEKTRMHTVETFSPALGTISKPFQQAASIAEDIAGISHLRTEMAALRQENSRLRQWYQTALMLEAENKSLQELLNMKLDRNRSFITTRAISDPGNAYVHSMLVAAGSKDRVEKGQAVLAGEGLIGRIIEAGDNYSRVLLLNDFNSRIPVIVEGSRQKAVLVGNNSDLPSLAYMPPDANVSAGSRIVTSGDGGLFPSGLPIGIVQPDRGDGFKVKIFADMEKIIYVRIVDRPAENLPGGILLPAR